MNRHAIRVLITSPQGILDKILNKPPLQFRIIVFLALGIIYIFSIFPVGFLSGKGSYWETVVSDRATHLIGYLYYLNNDWSWTLNINNLSLPEGTSLIFTDSIPLLGVIAKAIKILIPHQFNYFGLWIGICYLLNGVSFLLILDRMGIKRLFPVLSGAFLCMLTPVLLHRWYHAALCSQFLILLAFLLYFNALHELNSRKALFMQIGLAIAALFIHPYLMTMVFAVFLATVIQVVRYKKISLAGGAISLSSAFLTIVLLSLTFGFVEINGSLAPVGGFGHFSINLLNPFFAKQSGIHSIGWELSEQANAIKSSWAFFGTGAPDATGGQYYEGFSYLGAGVLFLILVALTVTRARLRSQITRHWPLILVIACMLLFSLSNKIFFGHYRVLYISLPDWFSGIANTFRASGRFFWPAAYALLIFAVVNVVRRLSPRISAFVLFMALSLQWLDTMPMRQVLRMSSGVPETAGLDLDNWRSVLASADRLDIIPSAACGNPDLLNPKLELQVLAARLGPIPTNSALTARNKKDCASEVRRLEEKGFEPGVVYAFFEDYKSNESLWHFMARTNPLEVKCIDFNRGVVCVADQEVQGVQGIKADDSKGNIRHLNPPFEFCDKTESIK